MKQLVAEYKDRPWTIETIYFGKSEVDTRIRIGRINEEGQYEWDLVFEKELTITEAVGQ
jgi:hypothetical protein